MTVQTSSIASASLVLGLLAGVGCTATSQQVRSTAPATVTAKNVAPPFIEAPAEEPEDTIEILEDDPEAIAAAVAVIESLDDWGELEGAYAPVLECFNGRKTVVFDNLIQEASAPTTPEYALGWATVGSIETIEASADEAVLLVRGAAAIEGELSVFPDERIVVVRRLANGWRIAGEANRLARGCMSEHWAGLDDDPGFVACSNAHRACQLELRTRVACNGPGWDEQCLVDYEQCDDQVAACLANDGQADTIAQR